jgi:tetratricopeptide (TPR) repeat protein
MIGCARMDPQLSAQVSGSRNVVIQVLGGSGHTISVGTGPVLRLIGLERLSQQPIRTELDLLKAHHRKTRLVGRDLDFESLWQWLHSDQRISIRTLVGPGGTGKTRMAIALLARLASEDAPWQGGFVLSQDLSSYGAAQDLSDLSWDKPTLVIVDYAASSAGALRMVLQKLACAPEDGHPLRLLLLERFAERSSGWYQQLFDASWSTGTGELFDPAEPIPLEAVQAAVLRRRILEDTVAAVAELRKESPLIVPAGGALPDFDRLLEKPDWENPLVLMMAGLTAYSTGWIGALSLSRTDLALMVAERERSRIERIQPEDPAARRVLVHMAAYATLTNGLTLEAARAFIAEESAALQLDYPGGSGQLAADLTTALHGDKGIAPILPDIVGEAFVLLALADPLQDASATVLRAATRAPLAVATTIVHALQDFHHTGQKAPADWLRALAESAESDVALLEGIEGALPEHTLELRELAMRATGALLNRLADLPSEVQSSDGVKAERSRLLNNLASRLSELGRREEALAAAQEAVRLRRELAAARPDAFLPNLAVSLNNLAAMLSELGRREEALATAQEAVCLYRDLAVARPGAFPPNLAGSLNNLANTLSDLGRREEALAAAQEAVRLYRELAAARPDAFLPNLAMSLNNLANMFSELGRREEALAAAQEAVRLRRELATARPDAFLPNLAGALNNLANRLSELGRREEALAAAQEAVRLRRELAAARPDAFLPDLATSLAVLGVCLREDGRHSEAAQSFHQALGTLAPLFERHPQAFAGLIARMARDYLEAAARAEAPPDFEPLARIAGVLENMKGGESE